MPAFLTALLMVTDRIGLHSLTISLSMKDASNMLCCTISFLSSIESIWQCRAVMMPARQVR